MKSLATEINDPQTGKLIVFAARPNMGVNRICLNLANALAEKEQVLLVVGDDRSIVNFQDDHNIEIYYTIANDPIRFFYRLERIMEQNSYSWIIVDDLSRIFYFLTEPYIDERDRIITKLKRLVTDYRTSLIITTPLSDDVEYRGGDKRPALIDFDWSRNLTSLADALYAVYIPSVYGITEDEPGIPVDDLVEIICCKHLNKLPHTFQLYGDPFKRLRENK